MKRVELTTALFFLILSSCAGASGRSSSGAPRDRTGVTPVGEPRRLPATERALEALTYYYLEPSRITVSSLRDHAAAVIAELFPEIDAEVIEEDGSVWLRSPAAPDIGTLEVRCPKLGPSWGALGCVRKLASAVTKLSPSISIARIDRAIAASLLVGLDPHTGMMWYRPSACRFTPGLGCPDDEGDVGIETSRRRDGSLQVFTVTPKSPAAKAKIAPGDTILQIDGYGTEELDPSEADYFLSGPLGSKVHVTIEDARTKVTTEHVLERSGRSVQYGDELPSMRLGELGWVGLDRFDHGTSYLLDRALRKLGKVQGLILDLRDNPGGYVDEAVAIAARFVESGPLVTFEGRDEEIFESWVASEGDGDVRQPLVVLLNRRSASASELLSGALIKNDRAVVVGERSFGKGSMQRYFEVPGGTMKLTFGRYLLGGGVPVQQVGVVPDLEVKEVWLDPAAFRFALEYGGARESDDPNALSPGTGAKIEASKWTLTALNERWNPDDKSPDPERIDGVLRAAATMLRECGAPSRGKMLECAGKKQLAWAKKESERIRDFASTKLGWKSVTRSGGPLAAKLTLSKPKVAAGEPVELTVEVENKGAAPAEAVTVELVGETGLFSGIELPIGSLAPGARATVKRAVTVPARMSRLADRVRAILHAAKSEEAPADAVLSVEERASPALGLRVELDDSAGDKDGAVSAGESVQICAALKNLGATETPAASVSLDVRASPLAGVMDSYRRVDALAPGAEAKVCFTAKGRSDLVDGEGLVSIRYGEWNGRVLGQRSLPMRTRKTGGGEQLAAAPASAEWGMSLELGAPELLVSEAETEVKASAVAHGGQVRDVVVYVNGKKRCYEPAPAGATSFEATCKIPLEPGGNSVTAIARSRDGAERVRSAFFVRK